MITWFDIVNFGVLCAGLMLAVLGLILNLSLLVIGKWNRTFFSCVFATLVLHVLSCLLLQIFLHMHDPHYAHLSRIGLFAQDVFASIYKPVIMADLLHLAGENWKKNPMMRTAIAIWCISCILTLAAQFTGGVFYRVTDENIFVRGDFYPVLLICPVTLNLMNLQVYFERKEKYSRRKRISFSFMILLPLITIFIQFFLRGVWVLDMGVVVAAFFLFVNIVQEQIENDIAVREESIRQQAVNLALQMRPHFIYNTMMSIYYLCQKDPEKAQQVTLDFTRYLRKNFTAVSSMRPVPFREEMEHTRAYLAVEKVRFEGSLKVEYDTPYMDFSLPPLTLQPIVENAVKYGLDPERAPLEIRVSSVRTETGAVVTVDDNGPGFTSGINGEPHVALQNIRERLSQMCHGHLEIMERKEGGTRVILFIPRDV